MVPFNPYLSRATLAAHTVTMAQGCVRAWDVDSLLKDDASAYCLDAPDAFPAGCCVGYSCMGQYRHTDQRLAFRHR